MRPWISRLLRRNPAGGQESRDLSITEKLRKAIFATNTYGGIAVNPASALTFSAVYAAVNTIASDTAVLPLRVYRTGPDDSRERQAGHPVERLFNGTFDGESPAIRSRMALMGGVLTHGNGYAEIVWKGTEPTALYLLDPKSTEPGRHNGNGRLHYRIEDGSKSLPPYKTFHIAGLGYDGLKGYSPVTMARQAIGLGLAAETFGASWFGNGSRPGGYLTTPQILGDDAARRLTEDFEKVHAGPQNAGRLAVFEQGLEFKPFTIPPEDAQFLQTRQFQVLEIARMFRLPPSKIGDYSQAHQTNIEASNLDYLTTCLLVYLESIEQEINLKLFLQSERDGGFFAEHDLSAFLRADIKTRFDSYALALDRGWMTRNEVRRNEKLPPIPEGGDLLTVQVNQTSLSNMANPSTAPPVASPPA